MKAKRLLILICVFGLVWQVNGQVAINTTGAAPAASAMLDITSTSKGILIPRMISSNRTSISSPADGLLVYQTDGTKGFYYYNSVGSWNYIGASPWSTGTNGLGYSGNVGIGTSASATYKLFVRASISGNYVADIENRFDDQDAQGLRIRAGYDDGTKSTSTRFIGFFQSASYMGSITWDGGGNLSLSTSSDERFKSNIRDTKYGLDDLLEIKIRDFNWKDSNQESTGVIAQELLDVYPTAVYVPKDENETFTVTYSTLIPLMVKSIQDQQNIIETQNQKISDLEERLQNIELLFRK
ncbi:MAG: tail fiber domain-containing protein [Bacteroidales bacterium]